MKQYVLHWGAQFSFRSWQRFKEQIIELTECLGGKGCLGQGHPLQLQKPWRREAILWASLCVLLNFTAFPKLPEQFVALGNRIAQKKAIDSIDSMCCSHALKFNEMNLLCFTHSTVTSFSYRKRVPQAVCCSLPFYITFVQWTFWSTVFSCEQITQSGHLSLYKLCKIRVDLASLWDWWFAFHFRAMMVHSLPGKEIQDVLCIIPAEEWSAKNQK